MFDGLAGWVGLTWLSLAWLVLGLVWPGCLLAWLGLVLLGWAGPDKASQANKSVPLSSGATGQGSGWRQTHNLMGLRLASTARNGFKPRMLWVYGLHRLFGHGIETHKWRPSL